MSSEGANPMTTALRDAVNRLAILIDADPSEGCIWHRSGRGYWELHCLANAEHGGGVREFKFIAHLWDQGVYQGERALPYWYPYAPAHVPEDPLGAARCLIAAHERRRASDCGHPNVDTPSKGND